MKNRNVVPVKQKLKNLQIYKSHNAQRRKSIRKFLKDTIQKPITTDNFKQDQRQKQNSKTVSNDKKPN